MSKKIRQFETGATRDTNEGKMEYARFLDPRVIERFAGYMATNRKQSDGSLREPDNWKKGIPLQAYMDGLWRHMHDVWMHHEYGYAIRPETGEDVDLEEALCAVLFNAMGYLSEKMKKDLAEI